jgi:hypothetical protein
MPVEQVLTAYAGVPLFVRAIRSFDVPGSVKRHLHLKQRQRGFDEPTYVESFLVLNALGGDCLEDFDRLREDAGVGGSLGVAALHRVERSAYGRIIDCKRSRTNTLIPAVGCAMGCVSTEE